MMSDEMNMEIGDYCGELSRANFDNSHKSGKRSSKYQDAAKTWADLSHNWSAEERVKTRNHVISDHDGLLINRPPMLEHRAAIRYDDDTLGDKKKDIVLRLDFKNRIGTSEMTKILQKPSSKDEDNEEEGEIFSEEEQAFDEDQPESDHWTKRLTGPRMKMYADEEEDKRMRDQEIKRRYGTSNAKIVNLTNFRIHVDVDSTQNSESSDKDCSKRWSVRNEDRRRHGGSKSAEWNEGGDRVSMKRKYDDSHDRRHATELTRIFRRTIDTHRDRTSVSGRLGPSTSFRRADKLDKPSIKERLGIRIMRY